MNDELKNDHMKEYGGRNNVDKASQSTLEHRNAQYIRECQIKHLLGRGVITFEGEMDVCT
jgi:hypothetical protein